MRETPKASSTPADSNTAPVAPIRQQPLVPLTCTYCYRKGHLERNCFRGKRISLKTSSSDVPVSYDSASRRPKVPQTFRPPPSSRSPHASSQPPHTKASLLHEKGNLSSDECFAICRLKHHLTASKVGTLSGEASRQGKRKTRLTSETTAKQQHIHSSSPSVVAACSPIFMLTVKFMLN